MMTTSVAQNTAMQLLERMFAAPAAYQCIFATLAGILAIGLAIYLTAKDAKPRPAPQTAR